MTHKFIIYQLFYLSNTFAGVPLLTFTRKQTDRVLEEPLLFLHCNEDVVRC